MANPVKAAKQMFDQFLAKADPEAPLPQIAEPEATIGAHASRGGIARAASLAPKKRRQIAKRAAKARWKR
jgi:hypothetical protein